MPHNFLWNVTTCPCHNFHGGFTGVRAWLINYIPWFYVGVIIYPCSLLETRLQQCIHFAGIQFLSGEIQSMVCFLHLLSQMMTVVFTFMQCYLEISMKTKGFHSGCGYSLTSGYLKMIFLQNTKDTPRCGLNPSDDVYEFKAVECSNLIVVLLYAIYCDIEQHFIEIL